ncbi:altered inheritance of mitochondria protein 3-like [Haliotis rufescens]|uniref:altered inheritance of mitochondria protein 3-like n=1 Tax=Haliotis rufescens TaxID=6454 RepID=UPI001EB04C4A|nr:altered inheritance of mitochondria protein 3-like [Haliotis rufescens]
MTWPSENRKYTAIEHKIDSDCEIETAIAMSKQDPSKAQGMPPPQYAYGAPLQQQYGSQPPPYSASAQSSAAAYPASASQHDSAYLASMQAQAQAYQAQSQYVQQQYMQAYAQMQPMQHGYVPASSSAYPRQQYMPVIHQTQGVSPHGPPPPYSPVAQQMMVQQPGTVVVGGAFDAGARFDGISQPRIPPPPPGMAPSAAQIAQMQGQSVVGTQQSSNWFTGGSGGGATLW